MRGSPSQYSRERQDNLERSCPGEEYEKKSAWLGVAGRVHSRNTRLLDRCASALFSDSQEAIPNSEFQPQAGHLLQTIHSSASLTSGRTFVIGS